MASPLQDALEQLAGVAERDGDRQTQADALGWLLIHEDLQELIDKLAATGGGTTT